MENHTMNVRSEVASPIWHASRFRLLGFLPLLFFTARVVEYIQVGTPSHILWSCHVSNLLLAVGMFMANPFLIRIAAFWLILGLIPWLADMFFTGIIEPVSVFSHLGGFVMAMVAVRRVRMRRWIWVPSMIYFLVLQQVTRFTTLPDANINVAHYAYGPWKDLFGSYWKYWLVDTAILCATLWVIELALLRIFPERERFKL